MYRALRNLCLLSLVVCLPHLAAAQEEQDEIKIIPYSQIDPDIPHPAYLTARVTLKGIIRNAQCDNYRIWWDTNFNDNFNDDASRDVSRNAAGRAVYDIGRNFVIPNNFNVDSKLNVNVRVRPLCGNRADKFATMKFFVYAFEPNNNPNN